MGTRWRSVSIHGGAVPPVAAAALLWFGVGCGAPRVDPALDGTGRPHPTLEEPPSPATSAPEDAASLPAVRLRWRHDMSLGRLVVRIDEVRGAEVFPLTLPVRLHHVDGSLEDALLRVSGEGEACAVRCVEEPVAVSFDPDGALDGVITIESGS